MNDRNVVDELLVQAHEFGDLGDYAQAVRCLRTAVSEMETNDPRRDSALSSIEYLNGLQVVPEENSTSADHANGSSPITDRLPDNLIVRGVILAAVVLLACAELALLLGLQTRLYPGSVANFLPPISSATGGALPARTPAAAPTFTLPTLAPITTPNAQQSSPTETPTPLLPPTALPLLPPAPTVAINTNTPGKTVFEDVFNTGKLDETKWAYDNRKSTLLEWSHNTLRLYSGSPRDAYVHTRDNPFPTDGAFSAVVRWRYVRTGACHAAVGLATFAPPPADAPQTPTSGATVSIWFGYGGVHFSSDQETQDILVPDWGSDWHDIVVRYLANQYVINVDGKTVFTSHATGARVKAIWFGSPADLGAGNQCEWDTLEVDHVEVEQLSQQQGIRSALPLSQGLGAAASRDTLPSSAASGISNPSPTNANEKPDGKGGKAKAK